MIDVLPVIVGINHWRDVTSPFIDSIRQFHPTEPLVVVDNHSRDPYPAQDDIIMLRTNERMGYNNAMNYAVANAPIPRWYVFFNNDCLAQRPFFDEVLALDPLTVYGSGANVDSVMGFVFQWSAWLCVSREAWERVGEFDPQLTAGFEDFDYQIRAKQAGLHLATADLPVQHLDKHTRKEEPDYNARWRRCVSYFASKHNWKVPDIRNPELVPC
jgi:GT2 family glycosyltransferase